MASRQGLAVSPARSDVRFRQFIFKVTTGFYALFVVILGVVIDLSSLIVDDYKPAASGRDLVCLL